LPTFEAVKTKQFSNSVKATVGNVTVRIYKRKRRTARGKFRTVFEVASARAFACSQRRPRR
jgi:hypothetical protein